MLRGPASEDAPKGWENTIVNLELLTSLDGLIWLQSGKQVGEQFQQHQTTVSRNQKKCAQAFGLSLRKQNGIWEINGNTQLLNLEREVHQRARFTGHAPLRLEANGWMDGVLGTPSPEGWISGACKPLGLARCLELLEARIVDAWLCQLPDLPDTNPRLSIQPLCSMPTRLMVAEGHPLLKMPFLTLSDVRTYPWQRIKPGAYPRSQALLQAQGIWPPLRRGQRLEGVLWEGLSEEKVVVTVGSVLSSHGCETPLIPLPLNLNLETGVALVILREHADRSELHRLRSQLRERIQQRQALYPELQLLM